MEWCGRRVVVVWSSCGRRVVVAVIVVVDARMTNAAEAEPKPKQKKKTKPKKKLTTRQYN